MTVQTLSWRDVVLLELSFPRMSESSCEAVAVMLEFKLLAATDHRILSFVCQSSFELRSDTRVEAGYADLVVVDDEHGFVVDGLETGAAVKLPVSLLDWKRRLARD